MKCNYNSITYSCLEILFLSIDQKFVRSESHSHSREQKNSSGRKAPEDDPRSVLLGHLFNLFDLVTLIITIITTREVSGVCFRKLSHVFGVVFEAFDWYI
jgi:hypothetical protein